MQFRRGHSGLWIPEGHRLTLESGVSVSTTDQTAKGTLYSTPHPGSAAPNWISVSDGANLYPYEYGEISLALTATSGKNYDVFRYLSAGVPTLILGDAWTNDTTRADAISLLKGKYVLTSDKTYVYVGTLRASGANVTEDSETKRFLWNVQNTLDRPVRRIETTASWTYNSTTIRQARATATNQIEVVCGLAGAGLLDLMVGVTSQNDSTVASTTGRCGIGEDATNALAAGCVSVFGSMNATGVPTQSEFGGPTAYLRKCVPLGYHYYAWVESCNNVGAGATLTFYSALNGSNSNILDSGLTGTYRC